MRFGNGLALLSRTNSKGHWNLASFHSPHSLTWRWILSFSRFRSDEARILPLWWLTPSNQGARWGFRIPFVGVVSYQTQRPMWYRELYMRRRDERDFGEGRARKGSAYVEPPPLPPIAPANTSVH